MNFKVLDFAHLDSSSIIDEASRTFKDELSSGEKRKLQITTIATHSGKIINDRVYPGTKVKAGAKTFFKSEDSTFDKPFLKNHDRDSDPLGRVVNAEYVATRTGALWTSDYNSPTEEGSGFLKTTSIITDQDAIEKFLDGRYQTVSQSAVTDGAYCAKCTCNKGDLVPLFSSWKDSKGESHSCEHWPGDTYDGKVNYMITGKLTYSELSQVNTPADDGGVHTAMSLIEDQLNDESSLFGLMGSRIKSVEIIKTPIVACVVDSEGNPIKTLMMQDYISTKTISVPAGMSPTPEMNTGNKKSEDSVMSSEDFATAKLLSHFNKYRGIELTSEDKVVVAKLESSKLTEDQKDNLVRGFFFSDNLPFEVCDEATVTAAINMADKFFPDEAERESFLVKLKDQATVENLNFNNNKEPTMDEKQTKALLDSLEQLKADKAELEQKIKDQATLIEGLRSSVIDTQVIKLISVRAQVGYADCLDFESKTAEEKLALVDSIKALSPEIREHMLKEANDNLDAGISLSKRLGDDKTVNPLEGNVSDKIPDKADLELADKNDHSSEVPTKPHSLI